jgi:hypothetical protein
MSQIYEFDWNGHKVGCEVVVAVKFWYAYINSRLKVDGNVITEVQTKINPFQTVRATFNHEGKNVEISLHVSVGLIGILHTIKIEGKTVHKKYVIPTIEKGSFFPILRVLMIFLCAGALFGTLTFNLLIAALDHSEIIFIPWHKQVDLSKVRGTIYFTVYPGKIMTYRPSTGEVDTFLTIDSTRILDISPDLKSALLVSHRNPTDTLKKGTRQNIIWVTFDDTNFRLIAEHCIDISTTHFTSSGDKVICSVFDSDKVKEIIVDTMGNTVSMQGKEFEISPSGKKVLEHKKYVVDPWIIFDTKKDTTFELDTTRYPYYVHLYWWSDDTIFFIPRYCYGKYTCLVPLDGAKIDTILFKGTHHNFFNTNPKRIINFGGEYTLLFSIGLPKYGIYVYSIDSLLWKTWIKDFCFFRFISPDGSYYIVEYLKHHANRFDGYSILGPNGRESKIPIPPNARILRWSE